jgi:hypothetical protein
MAWALQDKDGSWSYPNKVMLPLLESDRRFQAYLVALAVGFLLQSYKNEPEAMAPLKRLLRL